MKITAVFLLLLLVCSVSTNQGNMTANNKIPALQNNSQQPCLQDIHAVLRQMTASLTEQKMEIRILQRDNEDYAAKVKELETLKMEVDNLTTELVKQKTEAEKQKMEVEKLKMEVEKLKQQQRAQQVAFSASLVSSGTSIIGPFPVFTPLIYKHVVTNIGNAYNSDTGVFTPPVRGVYYFEWHVYAHGDNQHASGAVLYRNSEHIFIAYEHQPTHAMGASNGVTLLLEVGDVVFLRLREGTTVLDSYNHHTTFSGHLIFIM